MGEKFLIIAPTVFILVVISSLYSVVNIKDVRTKRPLLGVKCRHVYYYVESLPTGAATRV